MPQIARFVGIDVGSLRLDVHVLPDGIAFAVDNSLEGWEQLAQRLGSLLVAKICLEATGGYETGVLDHLHAEGFTLCRVNPAEVKAFAKGFRRRIKTDKADAQLLARVAGIIDAVPYKPNPKTELLAQIVGYRRRVVDDITALENQVRRYTDKELTGWTTRRLDHLRRCLAALDKRIAKALRGPEAPPLAAKLLAVASVGDGLAATLLARLPELETVNRREIAALVGVAPFQRQSGIYVGQAKIAGGRPDVRRVLYMATMSAIRHNKPIADFYKKLVADGKKGKVALVAAMRKFITILNAIAAPKIVPNP